MPYVVSGLCYFIRHGSLWKNMWYPIFLTFLFSLTCLIVVVGFALMPQVEWLENSRTPDFLVWPLGIVFVLLEMFLLIAMFSMLVLQTYLDKLFDMVLEQKGYKDLVDNPDAPNVWCVSKASMMKLAVSILSFPINFIPVLGTIAWFSINAPFYAWEAHARYYELKGVLGLKEQRARVKADGRAYWCFGMQAMALELIPGFNFIFIFTNVIGAALWAADLEDKAPRSLDERILNMSERFERLERLA